MYNTILKFGGSCSSSIERLAQTLEIVKFHVDSGDNPAVVASAIGASPDSSKKMTDFLLYVSSLIKKEDYSSALKLVRKAKAMYVERGNYFGIEHHVFDAVFEDLEKICSRRGVRDFRKNFAGPERKVAYLALDDFVAGFGELGVIELYAGGLVSMGIRAKAVDSSENGFVSNSNFKDAELIPKSLNELIGLEFKRMKNRNPGSVLVYSGFNAADVHGNLTTLGRDGSNVTALALGAALNSNSVIIYSDVPILPIDPRIVKNDEPIRYLSYGEFIALSNGGVKAIPSSMIDVLRMHQRLPPIYMRSAKNHQDEGTLITSNARNPGFAKAMAVRDNVSYREFPVKDDVQAGRLKEMMFGYEGISVIRYVDEIVAGDRRVTITYQVDSKFVDKIKSDQEFRQRLSDKLKNVDPEFEANPDRYFRQSMFHYLKQAFEDKSFDAFQLHDSSMLTIVGHDIGKSYEAISKVMEIIGRVQPGQQLQHTIHKLPIIRDRHYIQLIIPRGLENVAAEIYNALYVRN